MLLIGCKLNSKFSSFSLLCLFLEVISLDSELLVKMVLPQQLADSAANWGEQCVLLDERLLLVADGLAHEHRTLR